jgi:hypothetical protein
MARRVVREEKPSDALQSFAVELDRVVDSPMSFQMQRDPGRIANSSQGSRWIVAVMYVLPLGLLLLFWAMQDSTKWAGGSVSLDKRVLVGLWQATGPFAWVLLNASSEFYILGTFGVVWSAWLTMVFATRLRDCPYILHLLASFLWCVSGFPPAGLVIT